jgi:3-deoxy-D-manno-octulosonic-acid transferase
MTIFLYQILLHTLQCLAHIASFFNPKAQLWLQGRKDWRNQYAQKFKKKSKVMWMHVSSLGEFEQGRPLIEAFRVKNPDWQIVLTFFSPSGFELRKNYASADFIAYLPLDTASNAIDFIDLIKPDLVFWVKYDFWFNYLTILKSKGIPTYLVAAKFRSEQPFFKWYGGFWRKMLGCFTHLFVQEKVSVDLLQSIGFQSITKAGDTRIDRVIALSKTDNDPIIAKILNTSKFVNSPIFENAKTFSKTQTLIVGSSWPEDENIYLPILQKPDFQHLRAIVAPHEPSIQYVQDFIKKHQNTVTFSSLKNGLKEEKNKNNSNFLLLIDNVGMLNMLYRYGDIAFIGGGFGKGIHNTLEPAAYGLPVIFGPNYQKFEEAKQLIAAGGAFSVKNQKELEEILLKLKQEDFYKNASKVCLDWLEKNSGATEVILNKIGLI